MSSKNKNKAEMDAIERAARNRAAGINAYYLEIDNKNKYAQLMYDLYEACYIKAPIKFTSIWRYFGKPFEVNVEKYKQIKRCDEFISNMVGYSPDFDELFDFGSFIKYMEKVFFYKNDAESPVCCDSNIEDKNRRIIVFQNSQDSIKIKADLTKGTSNIIELTVERGYGKRMTNTYKIVDREVELRNDSDKTLMNHVVQLMSDYMVSFMLTMAKAIINKHISCIEGIKYISYIYRDDILIYDCEEYYSYGWDRGTKNKKYKDILWLEKHGFIDLDKK